MLRRSKPSWSRGPAPETECPPRPGASPITRATESAASCKPAAPYRNRPPAIGRQHVGVVHRQPGQVLQGRRQLAPVQASRVPHTRLRLLRFDPAQPLYRGDSGCASSSGGISPALNTSCTSVQRCPSAALNSVNRSSRIRPSASPPHGISRSAPSVLAAHRANDAAVYPIPKQNQNRTSHFNPKPVVCCRKRRGGRRG